MTVRLCHSEKLTSAVHKIGSMERTTNLSAVIGGFLCPNGGESGFAEVPCRAVAEGPTFTLYENG